MTTILNAIPFFVNEHDGNQCQQVCARTALQVAGKPDISLADLDRLSGRLPNQWTFTQQIVGALLEKEVALRYYSSTALEPFLRGKEFILAQYGADAAHIVSKVNCEALVEATKKILLTRSFEQRVLQPDEIEKFLADGNCVIITIDYNTLTGKKGPYQGHTIVLTGYDHDNFYYHENGPRNPKPHVAVQKNALLGAWRHPATDCDAVVIFKNNAIKHTP